MAHPQGQQGPRRTVESALRHDPQAVLLRLLDARSLWAGNDPSARRPLEATLVKRWQRTSITVASPPATTATTDVSITERREKRAPIVHTIQSSVNDQACVAATIRHLLAPPRCPDGDARAGQLAGYCPIGCHFRQ
jgi:hypothetical protein